MSNQPAARGDVLALGHRAAWLHQVLRQHSAALVPRDRDVLTLIALAVGGVSRAWLMDAASAPGISGPPAVRRADQLVAHPGLLTLTQDHFDIPAEQTHGH